MISCWENGRCRQLSVDRHAFGFGCAGLYGLPGRRERRVMLEAAYDAGIRHFDVAPMYGLGLAEGEMGDFMRAHSDVTVATKFGIKPTRLGAFAGLVQPPIRRALRALPSVKQKVRQSAPRGNAGTVGKMLYTPPDYSVASARRGLQDSLTALGTDHIDYFFLHEPHATFGAGFSDVAAYLEAERSIGTIRYWGVSGELVDVDADLDQIATMAPAVQHPYNFVSGHFGPGPQPGRRTITFGFIASALAQVRQALGSDHGLRRRCEERLGASLQETSVLVGVLVRDALRHNKNGTVLLSSTKPENLNMAVSSAADGLDGETEVVDMIRSALEHALVAP